MQKAAPSLRPKRPLGSRHAAREFWLRLMIVLAVGEMERIKGRPATGHPTLFLLDEFAGLKRMEVIENAAAQAAGFGVKFLFVVQNLPQLEDLYEKSWETFLGNSGLKLFFQIDDDFTRSYLSRQLGELETVRETRSGSQSASTSFSTTRGDRYPGLVLALVPGEYPLLARRVNYFESPRFAGCFDPHPNHPPPPTCATSVIRGDRCGPTNGRRRLWSRLSPNRSMCDRKPSMITSPPSKIAAGMRPSYMTGSDPAPSGNTRRRNSPTPFICKPLRMSASSISASW
jgi:hypothetical protein